MTRLLFFDNRDLRTVEDLARVLEQPVKRADAPLLVADSPWENGNFTMYGSVVRRPDGRYQLWYTIVRSDWTLWLAYAESDDGLAWRKPLLDLYPLEGQKTNIVLGGDPHGAAIIYDERDPREDWRYKLVAGSGRGSHGGYGPIFAFHSADGIRWQPARKFPAIATGPDCPMGFLRLLDGRYAAYHRVTGLGRRVFRSESWDFVHWSSEPRLVFEPDAGDPPLTQFYGMGSAPYGPLELGTLWIYHVDPSEPNTSVGVQETELAYARSGYAWHRARQGTPFIPHGAPGAWDEGNLQCASAPVFLDDEVRFYYAATNVRHARRWELLPQRAGLGMASCRPDRFVALEASDRPGEVCTMAFAAAGSELRLNARTEADGWIRAAVCDERGIPHAGRSFDECLPFTGDSLGHVVRWRAAGAGLGTPSAKMCLRLRMKKARLYSVSLAEEGESPRCDRFETP